MSFATRYPSRNYRHAGLQKALTLTPGENKITSFRRSPSTIISQCTMFITFAIYIHRLRILVHKSRSLPASTHRSIDLSISTAIRRGDQQAKHSRLWLATVPFLHQKAGIHGGKATSLSRGMSDRWIMMRSRMCVETAFSLNIEALYTMLIHLM
jgi:hypothetical protein